MSKEVTSDMFVIVAQFIGSRYRNSGSVDCESMHVRTPSELSWEEFVCGVYDYMMSRFIVQKDNFVNFEVGVNWLKSQKWKVD